MAKIAILALPFRVVRLARVLALRRGLGVAFLMVTRTAHVLGTVLFVHVLANELLAQFRFVELLESLAVQLFVLSEVGVHQGQILDLDGAHRVAGQHVRDGGLRLLRVRGEPWLDVVILADPVKFLFEYLQGRLQLSHLIYQVKKLIGIVSVI